MLKSNIDLQLPYISADLPGIGGQIRATSAHFTVEEIPLYEPQDEGQHLYVKLTKVDLTTKEVQKKLERIFDLKKGNVSFAGMKDKYACTTQTFSLSVGHQNAEFAQDAIKRIEDALPVTVHWARFHKNKLKLGHLLGNRFEITITDLEGSTEDALQQAKPICDSIKEKGLPNFFGPQRFGRDGENVGRGLAILRGERQSRDRWLKRFLISSYQSYLCNQYLTRRVEIGAFDHLINGDVAKKHETGGIFTVEDIEVEQPRYEAKEVSFTAPLYGPKMREAQAESGQLEAGILAEAEVTSEHLKQARIEGTRRLGRILLPDLEIRPSQNKKPSGVTVLFSLPKGAFATTVLREIMKISLASVPESDTLE